MKARVLFLAIALLTLLLPGAVMAQQLFDFIGMALLPDGTGDTATMYATVGNPAPLETPLPLDFANYEYTIVITGLTLDAAGFPENYSGGTITLYQDNGTAADYAAPGTFTDGEALLIGDLTLELYHMSVIMPSNLTGNGTGIVDWTGGTQVDEFAPEDQSGWIFFVETNAGSGILEDGYDEVWDGKVEPEHILVDTEEVTWDELKSYY